MELDFRGLIRSFKIIKKTKWFNKLIPRVHVKVHVQKLKTFFKSETFIKWSLMETKAINT